MTIAEAIAQGHTRLRKARWALPTDYMKFDVIDGHYGPWGHLYSELQLREDFSDFGRPQNALVIGNTDTDWEPYTGPLPEDDAER